MVSPTRVSTAIGPTASVALAVRWRSAHHADGATHEEELIPSFPAEALIGGADRSNGSLVGSRHTVHHKLHNQN